MKKIEDYKGTKTAIKVNSIEEFDKIKKLLGATKQSGAVCFKKDLNYISCWDDGYCTKEWYLELGYELLKASEFLEESIPEYVSIKDGGCNSSTRLKAYKKSGQILKIISEEKGGYYSSTLGGNTYICEDNEGNKYGLWTNYCEKSTKEEYDLQNKPKFEVGKWYKCDDWYGKFDCIHNSGKRIKFSETIINNIYNNNSYHLDLVN